MASGQLTLVVRHIHKLAGVTPVEDLADGQLLERFLASHEEEAFTALVRRHGSMVLGVCRRILRNRHAAEDAFQATFLVLLRKARSLDRRGSVASWLYTVAYHVALKARASDARRQQRERKVAGAADATHSAPAWDDLAPLLDEELNRLPETYRAPVVLCYLEGRTNSEAAQVLGWPLGTVKGRLARARELLRNRLLRRGVTLSGGLAAATLPASLVQAAVRTALPQFGASAGAASASAVALAEGALQTMFTSKLKLIAAFLLLTGLAIFGLGTAVPQAQAQKQEGITIRIGKPVVGGQDPAVKPPAGKPAKGAKEDRVIRVDGSVLGADGKGLAGAQVTLVAWSSRRATDKPQVLAQGRTDQSGKFRLKADRPAGAAVILLASARGHGPGWHWPTDSKSVEVRLAPEQVIRGRLFDLQGQPAAGVKLHVTRLGGQVQYDRGVNWWLAGGSGDDDFDDPIPGRVPPRGGRLGVERMARADVMLWDVSNDPKRPAPPGLGAPLPVEGLPGWPAAVATDKEGRFELRGVGKGQGVGLQVRDDRFALQSIDIAAQEKAVEVTHVLAPRRTLEGTITDADTGKPIPNARVRVYPPPGQYGRFVLSGSLAGDNSDEKGRRGLGLNEYAVLALGESLAVGGSGELPPLDVQADGQGRYKVNLFRGGSYSLRAGGPRGEPYLSRGLRVSWPQEAVVR
ncbi:MAG: sigma-70 family RNA polymerase sigma factor, partial [Gemmataceae bacterium]|nr:sigma-70 family RNA polymerase sigma factor [Gemmataceae bacterium]